MVILIIHMNTNHFFTKTRFTKPCFSNAIVFTRRNLLPSNHNPKRRPVDYVTDQKYQAEAQQRDENYAEDTGAYRR